MSNSLTATELLAHALIIELEAVQSYRELADQMRECGNDDVAELFEKMSVLEDEHATKIRERVRDVEIPDLAPWEFRWSGLEPPENIDIASVHYMMTPYQALSLALDNELSAMAFFNTVADESSDDEVRSLAQEFANDERQHVAWMKDWLAKYPPPDEDWDYDPDPPAAID